MAVRIPNISDLGCLLLEAAGIDYTPYAYAITQEQFDEYDQDGPGDYSGVALDDPRAAARWDAGITACKAAGVRAGSREGLLIRYRLLAGDETAALPPAVAARLEEQEAAARARQDADDRHRAELAAFRAEVAALVAGGAVVRSGHPEQTTYWPLARRAELKRELENRYPEESTIEGYRWQTIYRLPDGDLFVDGSIVSYVVTFNRELAADRAARKRIKAYAYDLALYHAVYDAEKAGYLRNGCCTWGVNRSRDEPMKPCDSGDSAEYGPEKIDQLRAWCQEILDRPACDPTSPQAQALRRIQALAVPGSICHVVAEAEAVGT